MKCKTCGVGLTLGTVYQDSPNTSTYCQQHYENRPVELEPRVVPPLPPPTDLRHALFEALQQWSAWFDRRYDSCGEDELDPQLARIAELRKLLDKED